MVPTSPHADSTDKTEAQRVTPSQAHLSREEQVRIILRAIVAKGGTAEMADIYAAVEEQLLGKRLSTQGKASLREVVNRHCVNKGYVYPHDPNIPGWRISSKGRFFIKDDELLTPNAILERARTAVHPSGTLVDVEAQDLTDEAIDNIIKTNRLRIGIVKTKTPTGLARQRRGQQRLRELTLLNYSSTCAVCDVSDPALLVASHIVAWADLPETRGLLSNVICLCRFHDVLFECGYWSLSDDLVVLRKAKQQSRTITTLLTDATNFRRPFNHPPELLFLSWHRLRSGLEIPT